MTSTLRPGEWVDAALGLDDIGPDTYKMRIYNRPIHLPRVPRA